MQKCPLVQSAFLSGFWTDLRHQYGIFGGESQTSLFPFRSSLRDVNERRLYSQATTEVINFRRHEGSWVRITPITWKQAACYPGGREEILSRLG